MSRKKWVYSEMNDDIKNNGLKDIDTVMIEISVTIKRSGLDAVLLFL
jgi:delta-aminolevulinic acid dehydratase/porphobilinogen synthase